MQECSYVFHKLHELSICVLKLFLMKMSRNFYGQSQDVCQYLNDVLSQINLNEANKKWKNYFVRFSVMNLADVTHVLDIAKQLKLKYPQFRIPYAPHAV